MPLLSNIPAIRSRDDSAPAAPCCSALEAHLTQSLKDNAEEIHVELLPGDIKDARRYLPEASPDEIESFAMCQLRARRRLAQLLRFYRKHHCRLARLHLLAACAITLGRFAGYSKSFDELGEAFMPVDLEGKPRTDEWTAYTNACSLNRPLEVRDELWLAAHMKDVEAARAARLDEAFYAEASRHASEPVWQLLKQHMEVTVGARLMDHAALAGAIAYETAFAQSLRITVRRLLTAGWTLLGCHGWEAARALLLTHGEARSELVSHRRTALGLMRYAIVAWSASRVFRRLNSYLACTNNRRAASNKKPHRKRRDSNPQARPMRLCCIKQRRF